MQITLKQSEIEIAVKQYVAAQGITLRGKTVAVNFVAGRKESGITVELDINETLRPAGEAVAYPALVPQPVVMQAKADEDLGIAVDPTPQETDEPAGADEAEPESATPAKSVSLFG